MIEVKYYIEIESGKAIEIAEIEEYPMAQILVVKGNDNPFMQQFAVETEGNGVIKQGVYVISKFFNTENTENLNIKVGECFVKGIYRKLDNLEFPIEHEIHFLDSENKGTFITTQSWEDELVKLAKGDYLK
jgi:hypothetical protein